MQHALQFLEAVLPANGLRVVAHKPPSWKRGYQHDFFESNEDAIRRTAALNARGLNAWYGLSSFATDENRTVDNTLQVQSLWLDVDYKQYESPEEAQDDAARLYSEIGVPTIRVQSGGGLHAYWVLRRALPTPEWKPLADAFQATWQSLGIKADPVSADAARVLRIPGSLNFKYDPPREVTLETYEDITYDPDSLARKLRASKPTTALPSSVAVPDALRDDNDDLTGGFESRPVFIKPIVNQCRQLQWAYTHQHEVIEPVWYSVIQLVRHVEDGRRVAHVFSHKHPGYSKEETDAKLTQLERNDVKPTTCEHFKRVNPQGCAGCVLAIKSPISLGFAAPEPTVPVRTIVEKVVSAEEGVVEVTKAVDDDSEWPPGFVYSGGSIYRTIKSDDGKPDVTVEIFRGHMATERLMANPKQNYQTEIQLRVRPEGQPERSIVLAGKSIADKRDISKELNGKGVIIMSKNASHILDLLQRMTQRLQARQLDAVTAEQMGWQDDGSFVVGTTSYRPDGSTTTDIPLIAGIKQFASAYDSHGSFARWKEMAQIYNRPGGEAYQFALCYGAAGVFLNEARLSGVVLSLVSQAPGRGKSTAGEAALSWWGNPDIMKSQSKDTVNAIFNKASRHKNLPILMDEVTTKPAWELEDLVYYINQGREKERLSSDANPRLVMPGWALPAISTSNNSVRSKLQGHRGDAQALFARVIEVSMDLPFAETMGFTDRAALKTGFKQNYGHAGPALVQYAIQNREKWLPAMDAIAARLDKALQGDAGYRFWVASCAATLVVAAISRQLGILDYDVSNLTRWVVTMLREQRTDNVASVASSADILAQFLEQNANRILVSYNRVNGSISIPAIWPEEGIRGSQLLGRAEVPERSLYVSQAAFTHFCHENGYDLPSFVRQAVAQEPVSGEALLKRHTAVVANLGRGTKTAAARTKSLEFNLMHPALREFAQGIDTKIGDVSHLRSVK